MTIKFPCPHCQKMLSVKEHLAGKKAACPACKQPLTIPAATLAPAADVEELAAAAFADEPAKKEEQAPQFVEFKCYYCDEQVKVSAELAGKQAPCPNPECRRIVKVPQLAKTERKDWRTVDTRTPLVAQRTEPAPEGAWGSTTSTGRVSRSSLEEAEALPAAAAPTGVRRWLVPGGLAAIVLLAAGGGWWGVGVWSRNRIEAQAIASAESTLKENQLAPEAAAEVNRAIGEYHLLTKKADLARIRFEQARSLLADEELTSRERDLVLADLAASQVELGGTPPEAEAGTRLKWEQALKEVVQTLVKIRRRAARAVAVREVSRRLIARGEGQRAVGLAGQVGAGEELVELTALIGLELLAARQNAAAEAAAEMALRRFQEPPPGEAGEPVEPGENPVKPKEPAAARKIIPPASLLALWVALDRRDAAAKFPPDPPAGAGALPALVIGFAEGLGFRGERDRALGLIKLTRSDGQVEARVGLAAALLAQDQHETARAELLEALTILEMEPGTKPLRAAGWPLLRLVRVGVRAGLSVELKPAAAAITDRELRGRAQLAILRGQLAGSAARVDETVAQDVELESPAHALALAAVARHNARVDSPKAARTATEGWEEGKHRPFGHVGVALGSRDARR